MAVFKEMGEVITIKVGGDGPADSIDIPLEFYPEKYLDSRKDEARRIQQGWCDTKEQIKDIALAQQELHHWLNDWNHESFDKGDVLKKVTAQWTAYREYLTGRGRFRGMEESGFDTDKYPDYRAAPCTMNEEEHGHQQKVEEVLEAASLAVADIEAKMKGACSPSNVIMCQETDFVQPQTSSWNESMPSNVLSADSLPTPTSRVDRGR